MEDHSLRMVLHQLYSPDLAPSDFFLFDYVKRALHGLEFQNMEKLLEGVIRILNAIPTDTLIGIFHEWVKRLQACIDHGGEYVE
jgi:hypothetical protein